ncbi:hypothetical protein, partial [Hydrogenophaga sp.]|uniref:hypothetical protein n=1 Tax=Hydrogenophaga sp. TaxID=1904254 RepID=UPI003565A5B4
MSPIHTNTPPAWLAQEGSIGRARLAKLSLLVGDAVALLLCALLATELAVATTGSLSYRDWMLTQSPARYLAGAGVAVIGLILFLGRYQH